MKAKMLVFDIGKININGTKKNKHLKIQKKRPLIPNLIATVLDKPLQSGYNKPKKKIHKILVLVIGKEVT